MLYFQDEDDEDEINESYCPLGDIYMEAEYALLINVDFLSFELL